MSGEVSVFPTSASTFADGVDTLYIFFLVVCGFFGLLIFVLVPLFASRYRRRSEDQVPPPPGMSHRLEVLWSVAPLVVVLILFVWGTRLYVDAYTPPAGALEIFVTGKQWMWKIQHPDGKREINELHVPIGQPIKLTMTSEDVIHSFYIPAFRLKRDVVPGRYTSMWFEATRLGRYHLFCAEYCGTEHSTMGGTVVVLTQAQYHDWLVGAGAGVSMESAGQELFRRHGCISCHHSASGARGPDLAGIYGSEVNLTTGESVKADEEYLRESILLPNAKLVAGYTTVMPTFQGQISPEGVAQLIAYIRSLEPSEEPGGRLLDVPDDEPAYPAVPPSNAPPGARPAPAQEPDAGEAP